MSTGENNIPIKLQEERYVFFFRVLLCLPTICFCISGAPVLKEFLLGMKEFIAKKQFATLLFCLFCIVVLFLLFGWGVIISVIYSILLLFTVPVLSCSLVIYCLCCQALLIVTMKMLQDVGGVRKVVYESIFVVGLAGALACYVLLPVPGTVWDMIGSAGCVTSLGWLLTYWFTRNGFDVDRCLFVVSHLLFFQALFWLIVEPFSWLLLFQFVCTIGMLVLEHFVGRGKSLFWIVCMLGGYSVPLHPFITPGYIDSLPRWIIAILSWGWP